MQRNSLVIKKQPKKQYSIIPETLRWKFLNKIFQSKMTIKKAAEECCLVFSTAKVILKNYKKEGRVGKKQHRDKKIKTIEDGIFNQTIIEIQNNPSQQSFNIIRNSFNHSQQKICKYQAIAYQQINWENPLIRNPIINLQEHQEVGSSLDINNRASFKAITPETSSLQAQIKQIQIFTRVKNFGDAESAN